MEIVDSGEVNGVQWRLVDAAPYDDFNNPRQFDGNVGIMVTWHRYYALGDIANGREVTPNAASDLCYEYLLADDDLKNPRKMQGAFERAKAIWLPIWAYEHGGITISTQLERYWPDHRWDCGQLGFIVAPKSHILKAFGGKILTAKRRAQARQALLDEVRLYDYYLRGEVYDIQLKTDDDEWEGVCTGYGFYESHNLAIQEAQAVKAQVAQTA